MSVDLASSPRECGLFLGALERTTPAEREAFLTAACGDDHALRQRVMELLNDHQEIGRFLEDPAVAVVNSASSAGGTVVTGEGQSAAIHEKPGDRIGRYRLLQQIGEGGCGVVYMAEQDEPVRRRVALKVIKLGMDTRSVVARFEAERQALALMEHPNIAKVFDGGATESGRPYFVMELVRGVRITDYCDQNQLGTEERLRLFISVCQAVQHAHQKGMIHRDLKPSNILVTMHDGIPVPKVIDFGIAKATEQRLTERTLFTAFDAFIGTPAYMSPEQAQLSELDVDTRSDIYSLGVLLYELVTGRTPFDPEALLRGGLDECRRTILDKEPTRPSTLMHSMPPAEVAATAGRRRTEAPKLVALLRGDLDWIVMKCLEKDRNRRYDTANALAQDVDNYLEGRPVLARPPSRLYRTHKFVRRNSLVVMAAGISAIALLVSASISTWQAIRASRAEDQAEQGRKDESRLRRRAELDREAARLNEYIADMGLAQQSILAGNFGRALQLVEKHRPERGQPDLRGFEWRYLWQLCRGSLHSSLPSQDASVLGLALSPDGNLVAVGSFAGLKIYDFHTKALVVSLPRSAFSLAFLADGKVLVAGNRTSVSLWRTGDWKELSSLPGATGPIALSPDGRLLATQGSSGAQLWDVSSWTVVRSLAQAYGPLAFSPDGGTLASGSPDGTTLWPLEPGRAEVALEDSPHWPRWEGPLFNSDLGITFSRDGRRVVIARNGASRRGVFVLSVWDARTGKEVAVLPDDPDRQEHNGVIAALALSPDGKTLATASWDHSIRLWDLDGLRRRSVLQGHLNEVWTLAFSPDGQSLVSGSKDGGVNVWPVFPQPEPELLPDGWSLLAISHGGESAAAVNAQGKFGLFDLRGHDLEREFDLGPTQVEPHRRPPWSAGPGGSGMGGLGPVAISADLSLLVRARNEDQVELWDTRTGQMASSLVSEARIDFLSLSPDGKVLLTGGRGQPLRWYEPDRSTQSVTTIESGRPLFAQNGRTLAVLHGENAVQIWDVMSHSQRTNFSVGHAFGPGMAISFDGRVLATTSDAADFGNRVYLWNTRTGRMMGECAGHKQPVYSVAFSPDGRTLATSGDDGTSKLWNVATQEELISLRHLGTRLNDLAFQADGRILTARAGSFGSPNKPWSLRVPSFEQTDAVAPPESSALTTLAPLVARP